jgi:hypothetical protein
VRLGHDEPLAADASPLLDLRHPLQAGGASDEVKVGSAEGAALLFYTYYFPGWRLCIDGGRLPDSALRSETPLGLLTVDAPPGEHDILLRWGDTPLRLTGKLRTLACLAVCLALVVPWRSLGRQVRSEP